MDVAGAAFIHAEYLQLNAELMISSTLITQLLDGGGVSIPCSGDVGTLTLEHLDNDADEVVSAGDRVQITYANCGSATGVLVLDISTVAHTGQTLDRLTGLVVQNIALDGSNFDLTITASQRISYEVLSSGVRWATTDGSLISSGLGVSFGTTGTTLDFSIDADTGRYELNLSGVGNFAGNPFDYETIDPFEGPRGQYPALGTAELTANGSAGRILHGDDPTRPTIARYIVDEDGDGQFAPFTYFGWNNVFVGDMFGVPDADAYIPAMPGYFDVTSRHGNLRSAVADVVMDQSRDQLYFSMTERNEIAVVDAESLLVTDRIPVGPGPEGLWLAEDGDTLYVAFGQGGSVGALDLNTRAVDYIEVVTALGNIFAYDVVEVSPGVLFVAGNPGPGGTGYLARVDRAAGDTVTRVADGRLLRDEPALGVDPLGQFLYAGDGSELYKLDIADPDAPVVAERQITASRNLSVSGDGVRLYLNNGEILRTSTLETLGALEPGVPYPLTNGLDVLVARGDFSLAIYEAQTRLLVDELSSGCGAGVPLDTVLPYGEWGQWLMLGSGGFCAWDFRNPGTPPGSDVPIPHPEELEPITVTSVTSLVGSTIGDIEYDASRNRIYISDPEEGLIRSLDADTFQSIENFSVDGLPYGIDLDPLNNRLAIAIRDALPLSILDVETGDVESFDISAALGHQDAADVAFAGDDAIFVSGDSGGASYIARAFADGSPAVRVADGEPISSDPRLMADPVRQRLYIADRNPYQVFALDTGLELAPIVDTFTPEDGSGVGNDVSLSHDGLSFAIPAGIVLRTSDLTQRGIVDFGASVFAADGSSLAVFRPNGVVYVYDPGTFTKTMIVDPDCNDISTSPEFEQIGDKNDWIAFMGSRICRFSLPTAGAQPTKLQPQLESKLTLPYACDSDCITRRLVLPLFRRAAGRDYSELMPELTQ